MLEFVEQKFGDLVAIFILMLGVALVVYSPASKETGSGLIMAALGLLKLTKTYRAGNANSNGGKSGVA